MILRFLLIVVAGTLAGYVVQEHIKLVSDMPMLATATGFTVSSVFTLWLCDRLLP